MARRVRDTLNGALREPATLVDMPAAELDFTIRIARRARTLGNLAAGLEAAGQLDRLPATARDQFDSALVLADSRARVAKWELDRIQWALRDYEGSPCIAMKGCAYLLQDLPNAAGRIFADVDLMVPEAELPSLERHLNARGWDTKELSPYDDNYYRRWTHELPPLMHVEREVEIDLHHNVLPRTARLRPDAAKIVECARPAGESGYLVPAPADMVLHAMTHLFNDEMAEKLRDLVDIDGLLRHFAVAEEGFWQRLTERAVELDLRRPAFYGLRYASRLLGCPVPQDALVASASWGPPSPVRWLMDRLVPPVLYPQHPDEPSSLSELARLLLYMRSHWIRMPPWLLTYHLAVKFWVTKVAPRFGARHPS